MTRCPQRDRAPFRQAGTSTRSAGRGCRALLCRVLSSVLAEFKDVLDHPEWQSLDEEDCYCDQCENIDALWAWNPE